jgi:gamma-glutamyl:cysteine ligase YbdK (ATP-grasp superfamily)
MQQNGIAMADHTNLQDALRLMSINQIALAAAVEELALWAKQQGASEAFQHVHDCLATLDENSQWLTIAIEGTDRFAATH